MDRDYELQTHRAEDRHWWYRGRRTVLQNVIADLRLPAGARILDAGAGSGRNMVELMRHGTVTAIELSPTSVCLARAREVGERAGWKQVRTTYFNSLLLPVAMVLRIMDRFSRKTTESSLDLWVPPQPLNWLMERPLALEAALIARGGRIPAGLSLLSVFR